MSICIASSATWKGQEKWEAKQNGKPNNNKEAKRELKVNHSNETAIEPGAQTPRSNVV